MVICDKCPCCHVEEENAEYAICSAWKADPVLSPTDEGHNGWFTKDCPILEIKLKDGTVFKPEVAGE